MMSPAIETEIPLLARLTGMSAASTPSPVWKIAMQAMTSAASTPFAAAAGGGSLR